MPNPTPAAEPVPFRYVDEDGFCLSARLLSDLNTGGTTGIVSITVEGSDEPQSAHVPVAELPKILAGIAGASALAVARQLLGTSAQAGCWCGHPENRHFTTTVMQLPYGCHDCQGWNGAHAYGQELPWEPEPAPVGLTADEAREMADELNTELYQARDALAFVGECCDIADREQRPVTTGDVREWLKGARCGRQLLGTTTAESPDTALEPQDHPGADLFVALRAAGLDVDEANRRIHAYAGMVLRQEKALAAPPAPADRAATRDRIRRAICEAEGFAWDTDMLEPDEYGEVADAVLAVLADGAAAGVQPPTEAHPPSVEYIAEVLELDGAWEYLGAHADPAVATRRRASVTRRHPDAETRTVRKTTTYTVEPEPADRCDTTFIGGARCSKPAGHRPPGSQDPHTPAAPAVPEERTSRPPRILVDLCEQHRPVIEPDPTTDGQLFVSCKACDGDRKQVISHGDPVPECRFWAMGKAYGYVSEERS